MTRVAVSGPLDQLLRGGAAQGVQRIEQRPPAGVDRVELGLEDELQAADVVEPARKVYVPLKKV